ncbi:MAG: protein kinase [Gemmatimonadota bacterium]|jgi:serine/threonine-protein kinase
MDDLRTRLQRAVSDRYRVEGPLGQGGTGVVFLAEDLKLGRKVALKVLRPELAESVGAERFLREIRIAAGLGHPNILSLIDSGEAEGLLYYVMFYVEGESLRDRLERERQLGLDEALRIGVEAAEALAHAHQAGVVHRDVKPENILLEDGHALVCDFGIARALDQAGGQRLTRTGLVVGTPQYMAPEQAAGEKEVDARADVYALGCVVYEMLAGSPPYSGATPQAVIARKVLEPLPRLTVVRDTVPPEVEAVVERALAKVPADRIQTAREFADALAGRTRVTVRHATPWLRRPLVQAVGGAAALALLLAGGLWLVGPREAADPGPGAVPATFAQLTSEPRAEDSPSLSPDGEWVVYAGEGPEGRDVFLQGVGGRRPINLTESSPEDDVHPAFSPDGERIAFRSERDGGGLFVMGRTGEAVRRITRTGFDPAWSPDGTRLVYATEGVDLLPLNWDRISELWVVPVEGGEPGRVYAGDAVQPSWSPDGGRIAFTARLTEQSRMDIWTIPADGGEPTAVTSDEPNDWAPTWSADGRHVYFSSDRGGSMNLWRIPVDPSSGEAAGAPEAVPTPAAFVAHPSVSADGRLVAYSSARHEQNVQAATLAWREGTVRDPVWLTTGSRQWSSPDPSPDGGQVVFYSRDLPEGDLYVSPFEEGARPRQVTADDALDRVPRWSPDGQWISYMSTRGGAIRLWWVRPDGSENHQVLQEDGWLLAWAPDGTRAVVSGLRPDVLLFDPGLPLGEQKRRTLPRPDSTIGVVTVNDWSPDGGRLAAFVGPVTDEGIVTFSFESETYRRLTDFGQWPVWLPDSRHILFVTGGHEFWIVDADTGELQRVYRSRADVLGPPRVSRDGRTVVFTRRVTEADVWLARLGG